jgi:hypothetical protein
LLRLVLSHAVSKLGTDSLRASFVRESDETRENFLCRPEPMEVSPTRRAFEKDTAMPSVADTDSVDLSDRAGIGSEPKNLAADCLNWVGRQSSPSLG